MEPYITITTLNDRVFCPKSIYFHGLYGKYSSRIYQQSPQIIGTINHENFDQKNPTDNRRQVDAGDRGKRIETVFSDVLQRPQLARTQTTHQVRPD